MEQDPSQSQHSENNNAVQSGDNAPPLEYGSPSGVIESINAAVVTMGGDGSYTDTERMSWKDQG